MKKSSQKENSIRQSSRQGLSFRRELAPQQGGESSLPSFFQIGRDWNPSSRREAEQDIFSALERGEINRRTRTGVELRFYAAGVSLTTIKRLDFALSQVLFNTSYREGTYTKEALTGLARDGIFKSTENGEEIARNAMQVIETDGGREKVILPYGIIEVGLSDLTAKAFGLRDKPTNRQKKEIEAALTAMQHGVEITYPNGDRIKKGLLWIETTYTEAKSGATYYRIFLNPMYTRRMKGYGTHPQDIMQRLTIATKRVEPEQMDLLYILGLQDRSKPYERYKEDLLREIGMLDKYRRQGARAKAKLSDMFEALKEVGLLLPANPQGGPNPEEVIGATGGKKYIFHLNPDYTKEEELLQGGTK